MQVVTEQCGYEIDEDDDLWKGVQSGDLITIRIHWSLVWKVSHACIYNGTHNRSTAAEQEGNYLGSQSKMETKISKGNTEVSSGLQSSNRYTT